MDKYTTTNSRQNFTNDDNLSDVTETAVPNILEIFGPSHPHFNLIHYTALTCLALSTILGVYIFIYLLKQEGYDVFRWKIGKLWDISVSVFLSIFVLRTTYLLSPIQHSGYMCMRTGTQIQETRRSNFNSFQVRDCCSIWT